MRPNWLRSRFGDGIEFIVMACDTVARDVRANKHNIGLLRMYLRVVGRRRLEIIRMVVVTRDRGNCGKFCLPRSRLEARGQIFSNYNYKLLDNIGDCFLAVDVGHRCDRGIVRTEADRK
jgi:hypothetical protein